MKDPTLKKQRATKKSKIKTESVDVLADQILNQPDDTSSDLTPIGEDVPVIEEEPQALSTPEIPRPATAPQPPVAPQKKVLRAGTSKHTAFIVTSNIREVTITLQNIFGPHNGAYFIQNESSLSSQKHGVKRKYKYYYVEDEYGFKYTLWFDITALKLMY